MKLAIILREPVDRCRSMFEFQKAMLNIDEAMDFDAYLAECRRVEASDLIEAHDCRMFRGLRESRYYSDLEGFMDVFSTEELNILFSDDLKQDPAGFTDRVCVWLGAAPASQSGIDFSAVNVSALPRNRVAHRIAITVNKSMERFSRHRPGVKRVLRDIYFKLNPPKKTKRPEPEQLSRLREEFREPNRKLRALLSTRRPDLALPEWLRDA